MGTPDSRLPSDKTWTPRRPPWAAQAVAPSRDLVAERVRPYVPRVFQQHLLDDPSGRSWIAEGSAAFVDISGFTQLSEQLARKGREGAEQITDAIGGSFEAILLVAYQNGGGLLKFGGDGLLLWFHGERHAERASRATVLMRRVLEDVGRIELRDAQVTLGMSQGVHSGRFHFFSVGASHIEFLPVGPAWSRLVAMESEASAGEIIISSETAALLAGDCLGGTKGKGVLLQREPSGDAWTRTVTDPPPVPPETLARCLSPAIRAHVLAGGGAPEHRPVTVAFIRFENTDALIDQRGPLATAEALQRMLSVVEAASEEQGVSFLASDVAADGGKLILTGGAPKVTGNDEERMLLAVRKIVSSDLPLPIRVGVHRGAVFAGDIGPHYRRTYTVMGDAVNLAARLMARAEAGQIYATGEVLDRCNTLFEAIKLEPLALRGRTEPVHAWSIGRAEGSRLRHGSQERLPLTGRNVELGVMRKVFVSARSGVGRLVEVVGEAGIGKTRLLEALRDAAAGFGKKRAACEAYTASTPYALWRELLRELMAFGRNEPDAVIVAALRDEVLKRAPDLTPWLPLIAIAFGVDVAPTPEVEMLAEKNRRARLHESIGRFLAVMLPEPTLVEIENAQHMDEASAELLSYLIDELAARPWLFAVARRPSGTGFAAPDAPAVVRIELKALAPQDALRMGELASQGAPLPAHVLEVVAKRSGGNPQFLRDLLRTVIASGGIADLPDSAEAAAMAQIDSLAPEDRAVVRHAAVLGLTFHPRMLSWFADDGEGPAPGAVAWDRLNELFEEEPDGYMRFRRSLLRDAAYQGLPYKLRRKLHGAVATRLEAEMDYPGEAAGTLSLHYFEAGEYQPAWRYATAAAKHAEGVYAHVEAAGLYARALEAGRRLPDLASKELAGMHQAIGDAWYRVGEFSKASAAYAAARPLVASDALLDADLMLKLSHLEDKLGNYAEALRWTEQARDLLRGTSGPEAARQTARSSAWHAMILQFQGRKNEAIEWAERTVTEAKAADDPEALADAYSVMGAAYGELGKEGAFTYMQRSLEAYERAGNAVRQAALLADLGVACQFEGRWDEALSYYERGRDAALKIGSTVSAVLARVNVAEILTDRGEWAEAEALLLETLPFWRASQFRFFLAACLSLLGRVSLRLGRLGEALSRLEEAKANFMHVGAQEEIPAVDARIAECRLASGNPDAAIELVSGLLRRASESNGIARVVPLLERLQGHALLQQGDLWGARDALEASLASARERRNLFETALTMLSLIEVDRLEGVEPTLEMVTESRTLLSSLKVRAVPPVPLPSPQV